MNALEAEVRAQAKVNLFLRVLAREDTGYHALETLFCRLELSDIVRLRIRTDGRYLRTSGRLPQGGFGPAEANLAWKAAELFTVRTGWPPGFEIELEKHIPTGAGLGGGSADAAAVLRILNVLSPTPLSPAALLELASSLGADVPFLTQDRATLALAWGRGERLLILPGLPRRRCWIVWPRVSVETREAYTWVDETARERKAAMLRPEDMTDWDRLANLVGNDFEPAVSARIPVVADLLRRIRSGAADARTPVLTGMSGSGSAIFVVEASDQAGDGIATFLPDHVEVIETATAERVEPVAVRH
ncbi:MAG TPA: 4-(cytidine 5'-diphospho)-2-C-methyl-D-erythritol kinase [Gemmatimonadaceae bacterium]|nr:4-(cytidine 5'-diphospho)-2-C-methyl-D-erythritol kinase [Gemmatimonadaceae bacterium]